MPSISSLLVKKPKYSTFPLSKTVRTTMAPGWVYPVYHKLMYTGDRFRFDIRSFLRTNPVFAPVMGSYKLRIATFVSSLHNYIPTMDYNRNDVDLKRVALPVFAFDIVDNTTAGTAASPSGTKAKYSNFFTQAGAVRQYGVNETSLFKFLGYPRGWIPSQSSGYGEDASVPGASSHILYKSALPWIIYMDIYRNYFVNPQEATFPICSDAQAASSGDYTYDVSSVGINRYQVTNIDKTLQDIRDALTSAYNSGSNDPVAVDNIINTSLGLSVTGRFAHSNTTNEPLTGGYSKWSLDHGLLCSATYDPDLNNNWMSVTNYKAYSDVSISVSNVGSTGSFTYEQLVRGSRQYDFAIRTSQKPLALWNGHRT